MADLRCGECPCWEPCGDARYPNEGESERREALAAEMHESWLRVMRAWGRHSPDQCSAGGCGSCHAGIRPWSALTEQVKEINREGARGMLHWLGFDPERPPREGAVAEALALLRAIDFGDVKSRGGFLSAAIRLLEGNGG
jgi:hypothetical protein